MFMTRRNLLKSAAAVAGSAAVVGLAAATANAASATVDPTGFSLTPRDHSKLTGGPTSDGTTYADVISYLNGSLNRVAVADLNLNRSVSVAPASVGTGSAFTAAYLEGYAWQSGDQNCDYWVPQGITTTFDSNGTAAYAGKRLVLTSWHFDTTQADTPLVNGVAVNRGVRLSILDLDTRTYRHLLLVEPYRSGGSSYSFAAVPIHSGGIALFGDYLYVVDSAKDLGVRVFDLSNIWEIDPNGDHADSVGYVSGYSTDGFGAYDYRYVVPQVLAYDTDLTFQYSYCSIDRTDPAQPGLVVGEYGYYKATDKNTARVVTYPLSTTTHLLAGTTAVSAFTIAQDTLQGVVIDGTDHYFSVSNGSSHGYASDLAHWTSPSTANPTYQRSALVPGPEDLAWGNSVGTKIWTQSEDTGARYVYAIDPSAYTYPSATSTAGD